MKKPNLSEVMSLPIGRRDLNRFLSFYRKVDLDEITAETVVRYLLNRRASGIVSKTLKADKSTILYCLRIFSLKSQKDQMEFLEIKTIIHESIKLHCPPTRIKESDLVTENEMKLFLKMAPERLRIISIFLWTTGVRPSEMLSLKWKDGRQKEELIEFTIRGKGERTRYIVVPSELVVRIHNAFKSKEFLFSTVDGKRLTQNALNKLYSKYGKRILGRRIFPYLFRHTFATAQIKSGNDVGAVAEFMGNSPELLVRVYLHSSLKNENILSHYRKLA